jgi:hypothetical protein
VAIAAEPAGPVITELSRYMAQAKDSQLSVNVIEKPSITVWIRSAR